MNDNSFNIQNNNQSFEQIEKKKGNKGLLIALIIVVIVVIIGLVLFLTLKPKDSTNIDNDNINNSEVKNDNENNSFKYKEISNYMFAIPTDFSTARSSNGTTITNDTVFILVTTSEYDNCSSYEEVVATTKDTLLEGVYSAFGVSAKNLSVTTSEKVINNKGIEILKTNGELTDYNSKLLKKYVAYYTIVDGDNGKYPIYWIGIPNGTDNMTEVNKAVKLIADNFFKN